MHFTDPQSQSLADWLAILDWPSLPNFGNCHTQPNPDDFRAQYFVNDALSSLYKNICTTMSGGVNTANIRLTGNPGAGKTSFLYAIKDKAENGDPKLRDFYFYIFHINRAHSGAAGDFSIEILRNVLKAWELFYRACGLADRCTQLMQQGGEPKDIVNRLADYYVGHKLQFNKCLVFVVDNADLLPGEEVATISAELLRHMEQASVKKWLVLRDTTYDNYKGETKLLIEQFFPDPYAFPNISLFDLAAHRIASTMRTNNGGAHRPKMPFSRELCEIEVSAICDHNLREGLSLLKTILEDNLPKGIDKNVDEKFVQEYLQKAAVRSYLLSHKLIDLHADTFRVSNYPLAPDVLCCASHHASESIIFAAVNDCVLEREEPRRPEGFGEHSVTKVRKSDFDYVVSKLEEHRLIHRDKQHGQLRITPRGRILSSYVPRDSYYDFCRLKSPSGNADADYWGRAARFVDPKTVVSRLLAWRRQRGTETD